MIIKISTSLAIFPWKPSCWIRVTGSDAVTFLQGQFSNDLRLMPSSGAVYGLWLTLKGKVLADSFVVRGEAPDEYWIASYFSPAAVIFQRLEGHVIADDVVLEDRTAEWSAVSIVGEGAEGWKEAFGPGNGLSFAGRRSSERSVECVYRIADGEPANVKQALEKVRVLTEEDMARMRIAAGIPAIGVDVGVGDLPNEAGLETEAISYTKGCYLGQEVMARLKSMGQVRRRLMRLHEAEGQVPRVPAAVYSGGRRVGEVRSAVADGAGGWIGLAMLSRLHPDAGEGLALAADGPSTLHLVGTP